MTLPPVARLLPHEGAAVLLEEVAALREDGLSAWFIVRPGTAFSEPDGSLAPWAVPEVMAQAVSAFGNLTSARAPSRDIGLLLGIRACRIEAGAFAAGSRLRVEVTESTREEDGRGVFNCRIMRGDSIVAEARLTAFQPDDPGVSLEGRIS
jgi:predicted hotdog family 3-hydroxylacyl-ACP dehydratase